MNKSIKEARAGLVPSEETDSMKKVVTVQFDSSELATVLAALRHFQNQYEAYDGDRLREIWPDHFADVEPLGTDDIDTLCEHINFPQPAEDPVIVIEGGVVQSVFVPVAGDPKRCKPVTYCLIDYDNLKDGDMSDEDVVEEWNSFSPALKRYYRESCKEEFEKYFEGRLNEACTCDDRSWRRPEHDSACEVDGER